MRLAAAARIVVLSGEKNARLVRHMIELGAAGFIPKWLRKGELQAALTSVLAGGIFLPPEFHWDVREPEPVAEVSGDLRQAFPTLTERQADVLRIVLRGCPDKLVARELGISLNTVRTHMRTIFEELGVQSRGQAVYLASRRGVRIA